MDEEPPRLTTAQAAARLGVKPATLYAYVSRGLLPRVRGEGGGSEFDPLDVESFAAGRRKAEGRRPGGSGRPLMVVDSPLTLVAPTGLSYRGRSAVELAQRPFEDVVGWFWGAGPDALPHALADASVAGESRPLDAVGVATAGPPLVDRLIRAVLRAGEGDPGRRGTTSAAAWTAGVRIIHALIDAQGAGDPPRGPERVAARLWRHLAGREGDPEELALLDAALVLCIDHDLAASTMAARIAASARADAYACVVAALAALSGLAHGGASSAAVEMLTTVLAGGSAEAALAVQIAKRGFAPGFGHSLYRDWDPRARHLFARMQRIERFTPVVRAAERLSGVASARLGRWPNVDLALAALVIGAGMPPDSGEAIFAVGRSAGWIAHVVDEYAQPPLRLRPESRYVGPMAPITAPRPG